MTPSQRVVFNTIVIGLRSMVALVLALFSGRWVLGALGQTDFGLFSVVGSVISCIVLLNSVMVSSVARHYAYAIGRGEPEMVNRWFNTAFIIHLSLATVLILIGWPIGEYLIIYVLNIPAERVAACQWVFRISLAAAFINMVSMPFVAMFSARQRLLEQAYWLMGQTCMVFFLALHMANVTGDRLMFYASGMAGIIIFIQLGQSAHALAVFADCRPRPRYWHDWQRAGAVFAFAGWNLFSSLGGTIRDQGSAILLNLRFGPKVNAAYGIANQVLAATNFLTYAMLDAMGPEVTSREGGGGRERMLALAQRASKFGTIMATVFCLPLIAEMDYVLKLWLNEPPLYAKEFCQLLLIVTLLDRVSIGISLAVNAHGRVAVYQAIQGIGLILTLPLAWLLLQLGATPTGVAGAFVINISAVTIGRVLWMRRLMGVPFQRWLREVCLPCALVLLIALPAVFAPRCLLAPSFARLMLVATFGMTTALLAAWFLALDAGERLFLRNNARNLWGKVGLH